MTTTIDRQRPTHLDRSSRPGTITVNQYSRRAILAIWAAAALPMGALAWIVAPAIADGGGAPLTRALLVCLTAGLIWQFVLVVGLVGYEQRSLRWSRLREGPVAAATAESAHRPGRRPGVARRHPPDRGAGARGAGSVFRSPDQL